MRNQSAQQGRGQSSGLRACSGCSLFFCLGTPMALVGNTHWGNKPLALGAIGRLFFICNKSEVMNLVMTAYVGVGVGMQVGRR